MAKQTNDNLPDDIEALKQIVLAQQDVLEISQRNNRSQQATIKLLEEKIKLFQQRQFGKSSEKTDQQAELFDEVELESTDDTKLLAETLADTPEEKPEKSKAKPGRKKLPQDLPRIRIVHDLSEHEKACVCGCQKTFIGEETSEQLDIIPAVVQVLVHVRNKYACKQCESGVATAPLPPQPIAKSNASPGLLAHVAVAKYQDGLPLYRMEAIFKRYGLHIPRNTLANWMIKSTEILQPLYNLLNDQLLSGNYIHMDETRVQVLKEPDKKAESLSYMWVRRNGVLDYPIVLFDYASSRRGQVVESLLGDYQGYLQTDDYAGYHRYGQREGVEHLGCFAHARRKFVEAQKVTPSKKGKVSKADMAVNLIKVLYRIESEIKDLSADEKYLIRQQKSVPQLNKLRTWLDAALQQTLPKGKTGEALSYLDKNWSKLSAYANNGILNIDNNPVENAIRPFAIGRKNWMFSDSQSGAKASAMLYSIIETAKANGLEPYHYLRTLFTRLPSCETLEDFEKLLPWQVELEELLKF